jgi:hypothetical protein
MPHRYTDAPTHGTRDRARARERDIHTQYHGNPTCDTIALCFLTRRGGERREREKKYCV